DKCTPGDTVSVTGIFLSGETIQNKFAQESNLYDVYILVKNIFNMKEFYYKKYQQKCLEDYGSKIYENDDKWVNVNFATKFLRDEIDIFNDIASIDGSVLKIFVKYFTI
ncbi:MAG: hypothetical protein MHPSP_004569, partial [Paramarteilia canceri]